MWLKVALLHFNLITTFDLKIQIRSYQFTHSVHIKSFVTFGLRWYKGNNFYYPVILCTFVLFFVYLALPRIVLNVLSSTEHTPGHRVMRYADLM